MMDVDVLKLMHDSWKHLLEAIQEADGVNAHEAGPKLNRTCFITC